MGEEDAFTIAARRAWEEERAKRLEGKGPVAQRPHFERELSKAQAALDTAQHDVKGIRTALVKAELQVVTRQQKVADCQAKVREAVLRCQSIDPNSGVSRQVEVIKAALNQLDP